MFKKIHSLVEEESGYFIAYIANENNEILPIKFFHYPSLDEIKATYEETIKRIEEERAKSAEVVVEEVIE